MEILRTIALYCDAKGLGFVVGGGHAVNALGFSRQTGDLDLIVNREQRSEWELLLKKLHYECFQLSQQFGRFKPKELAAWPIDLMFVDSQTFGKIFLSSSFYNFGVVEAPVCSPLVLIALKCHALKNDLEHRAAKDFLDIISVTKLHPQVVTKDELMKLCCKYASEELYHKLAKEIWRE